MIHWVESEDRYGLPTWLRLVECGHWGLVFTHELPRWINRITWEQGFLQIRPLSSTIRTEP